MGPKLPLQDFVECPQVFKLRWSPIFFGPTDQEEQQQQQEGVRRVEEMDDRDVYLASKNFLHNFW